MLFCLSNHYGEPCLFPYSSSSSYTLLTPVYQANLPNLRRLFVESRTEAEENEYSRNAFYNLVLFISSVAVFSLVAQRMGGGKPYK
ncbi:hypothetical protein AJ79_04735 [Helicocarpus griseus UAMH5409]|uniref:Uncharacterized protein n=1 Tax=Helicocarpus griseus UAMH5409 TaxID=1447875 RepID=A0A2B7XSV3_9EURO|nr:hypothetical protein AJ79_04735 [Helicocarpus griseus UAMH5409]